MTMCFQRRNTKLPHNIELRRLVELGVGRAEIAERFGASPRQVTARLRVLGVVAPLHGEARSLRPSEFKSIIVHRMGKAISLSCVSIQQSRESTP